MVSDTKLSSWNNTDWDLKFWTFTFYVLAWRERVAAERKKEGGSVKDEEAEGALDTSRDCQQRARK